MTCVVILERSVIKYVTHCRLCPCWLYFSAAHLWENCVHPVTLLNILLSAVNSQDNFALAPFCKSLAECLNQGKRSLFSLMLSPHWGVWSHAIICWIHRRLTTCQTPTDQRTWRLKVTLTHKTAYHLPLKACSGRCLVTVESKTSLSFGVRGCRTFLTSWTLYC